MAPATTEHRDDDVVARHRFNVDDYHRLVEVGVVRSDDRVELIEGDLITMAAMSSRHAALVRRLTRLFSRMVGDRAELSPQLPITLLPSSEPEPDLALLVPADDNYVDRHPGPDDVLLLVEVADSSARYDRDVELPLYARSGIAEVWVIDLQRNTVAVATEPTSNGYAGMVEHRDGTIAPLALPDIAIDVAQLLA